MLTDKESVNCQRSKKHIEHSYLKKAARKKTVIILEQLNMFWDITEIEDFRIMWKDGMSIINISDYFNRSQEECTLLVMDQSLKGMIQTRKGGLMGWENVQG